MEHNKVRPPAKREATLLYCVFQARPSGLVRLVVVMMEAPCKVGCGIETNGLLQQNTVPVTIGGY